MDIFYLFKLIYVNIDSVIISLITGMITSIFVTKIYFIKQAEDDKVKEVKKHTEALYIISGVLTVMNNDEKIKSGIKTCTLEPIRDIITYESVQMNNIFSQEFDIDLYDIYKKDDDLVSDMKSHIDHSKNISIKDINRWMKDLEEIEKLCKIRYRSNSQRKVIHKSTLKDKTIQIILLITITCIVIA